MYDNDDYDDYGPNGLDPYNQSKDKVISTEGCFSCKINGRGKRSVDNSNSTLQDAVVDDVLNASVPLIMRVKLEQTKHRTNIIQLQPALRTLKDHVEYHIVKGNEGGHFNINKKRGIWSLHFRRRLKEESDFNLEIRGIDKKGDSKSEESLDLNVRIQVVS